MSNIFRGWSRSLAAAVLVGLALGLTGCASTVHTKVNAFRADSAQFGSGTVAVRAGDEASEQSLEFAYYRNQLKAALAELGYTPADPGDNPDYEAYLSFDVKQTSAHDGRPRAGLIAGGYPWYSSYGSRFGVVVVDDVEETVFLRRVGLVLARTGSGERVYEVNGASQGQCGVLSVVFDEMLQALLKDFPAANGTVKDVAVQGDSRC